MVETKGFVSLHPLCGGCRLIVLVLSIVVIIIIIILQQFDDVNALQSPIVIRSSRNIFEHPLMDYPTKLKNQLICIF